MERAEFCKLCEFVILSSAGGDGIIMKALRGWMYHIILLPILATLLKRLIWVVPLLNNLRIIPTVVLAPVLGMLFDFRKLSPTVFGTAPAGLSGIKVSERFKDAKK